jgi:aldehyde:ferredoxin oxidoreductase
VDFYTGRVLRIDLTRGEVRVEALHREYARLYVGGKGLLFRYLWDESGPDTDALAPESPLILAPGAFAGTSVATCSRLGVGFKSPQTGTVMDSYVGGSFGAEMRFAGYDLIIITGAAAAPTVVYIQDETVELRDGSKYWGMTTSEVETALRADTDPQIKILSMGPAGESMIPWACIAVDHYHKAGRGGGGAVMGSKNLKAVAVRGTGMISVGDARAFLDDVYRMHAEYFLVPAHLWAWTDGTPVLVDVMNGGGVLPTRNFSTSGSDMADAMNSASFAKIRKRKRACYQCCMACRNFHEIDGVEGEGPEYETIAVCGPNCGVGDISALMQFNALCDEMGLDTVSTGVVTGLAMDLTEKGIYDFGLRFGDVEAYLRVPEQIAHREGVGADLALGSRELATRHGQLDIAPQVKNLEMPGYDPRGSFGMSLAYATSDRGACHMRSYPVMEEVTLGVLPPDSLEGKALLNINGQNISAARWTGVFCDFWLPSAAEIAQLWRHLLGRDVAEEEVMMVGERIWNLGRLFNVREGLGKVDDSMPKSILTEPLVGGAAAGKIITEERFDAALDEYYRLRGWDEEGVPTEEKLAELGVDVRLSSVELRKV